jgi:YkoY family integral membrane protein
MLTTLFIILNIILLEIVLSIDNAAVLSTMVGQLPKSQQKKALTWGIIGAYIFRGVALLFASVLIKLIWLKVIGGIYLIYLSIKSLRSQSITNEKKPLKIPLLNTFWSTVVMVEFMDIIFSIDNIFSAVAFTSNFWIICLGVFIGILAIRFATTKMIELVKQIPVIEKIAFVVIGILGLKLVLSSFFPLLTSESIDLMFSVGTLISFITPVILDKLKNKKSQGS